jgi:hypothetical protein
MIEEPSEDAHVPLAASIRVGRYSGEDAGVISVLVTGRGLVPLSESANGLKKLGRGGDTFAEGPAGRLEAVTLGQTVGRTLDQKHSLLIRRKAEYLISVEAADFFKEDLGDDIVATGEQIVAPWRQFIEVVGPAGRPADFLRLDEAVALEADEMLACRHRSDCQGAGSLFDSRTTGAFEEDEELLFRALHRGS